MSGLSLIYMVTSGQPNHSKCNSAQTRTHPGQPPLLLEDESMVIGFVTVTGVLMLIVMPGPTQLLEPPPLAAGGAATVGTA